jgi:hypothetical protein
MAAEFRQLCSDDVPRGYAILVEIVDWLLGRGIQQYLQPVPEHIYHGRQDRGMNYGLFVDGELAGVVSLLWGYRPKEWGDLLPDEPFVWAAALAVTRKHESS